MEIRESRFENFPLFVVLHPWNAQEPMLILLVLQQNLWVAFG